MLEYDVIIIGAGPGGIFSAYELVGKNENLKIAVFEAGHPLHKRHCPIDGEKITSCIGCKSCSIMSGFGGAGAFSGTAGLRACATPLSRTPEATRRARRPTKGARYEIPFLERERPAGGAEKGL
jgi:uncharacterized FAD-dependent dehydrogenase